MGVRDYCGKGVEYEHLLCHVSCATSHAERSRTIRESNRPAESKHPYFPQLFDTRERSPVVGFRTGVRCHRGSRHKTNAARASHPSRIVFADVLNCRLSHSERSKIVAHRTPKNATHRRSPEACASGLGISVFHPSGEKGFSRRPQSPGTGTLDMHRISPGDSLSKITGNAEPSLATDSEQITLLTASTLRQRENKGNGKLRLGCVKTVEGRNFLWKRKEKCAFIRARGQLTRRN